MGVLAVFSSLGVIFLIALGHSMFRLIRRWPGAGQAGSWQRARFLIGVVVLPAAVAAVTAWVYFSVSNSEFGE